MEKINNGIHGFGRIGRGLFRLVNDHPNLDVVAVNHLASAKTLAHVMGGFSIRVPDQNNSLTDIAFNVKKETSIQEINDTFEKASVNELRNILFFTKDPLVSIDINNSYYS